MQRAIVSLVILLSAMQGCSKEEAPIPEPESRPAKLLTVSVGSSSLSRTFPAQVEAGDKAILAFRVPGQLQNIPVSAGQMVKKGELLAELNPDEYSVLRNQAKAEFELADVQYKRMSKLRVDRVVSEQDFDQAQANYNSAKASLNQASANLSYTKLVAPYDGTISITNSENFEFVGASQPVMNIQTTQMLKVVFQLPDHLLRRFTGSSDAQASVVFDIYPDDTFSVDFLEIDTEADAKTASYKVTTVMESPEGLNILPGISGQLTIEVPSTGATRIPKDAVFAEESDNFVWRVTDASITEKVAVSLNEKGEVTQGLNDGDRIVISGVANIDSGMKVREWVKERGL